MKTLHISNKTKILSLTVFIFAAIGSGIFVVNNWSTVDSSLAATDESHDLSKLTFNMPSQQALKTSDKKVFAHHFPPFALRAGGNYQNPSGDYYEAWLTPTGEGGKHLAYGGRLRDKPLYYGSDDPVVRENLRSQFPEGSQLYKNVMLFEYNDMKVEIVRAASAGLDGFAVDIIGNSLATDWRGVIKDNNKRRVETLLHAAEWYNNLPAQRNSGHKTDFKIILMPDGYSNVQRDPSTLASNLARWAKKFPTAVHKVNGKLVVSPFCPECRSASASQWQQTINILKNTHGIDAYFVPVFNNFTTSLQNAYRSFSDGYGQWNTGAMTKQSMVNAANRAHQDGNIWFQGMAFQDSRPKSGNFYPTRNTEVFRNNWDGAISGDADWVQLVTWNDYSENTQYSPSRVHGFNVLDMTAYYIAAFKNGGKMPAIVRDNMYLVHRIHRYNDTPNGSVSGYTKFMKPRTNTSYKPQNKVEVFTFLTSPAQVTVNVGGAKTTYNAPAGVSSKLVDMRNGTVSAQALRSGKEILSVTSPHKITSNFAVQNVNFHVVSALREGSSDGTTTPPPPPPSNDLPDLVVNNISWTPANPSPGDKVVFSVDVENVGNEATPSGTTHGVSFWINGSQVSWSDDYSSGINPGQKVTLTANGGSDGDNNWIPGNEGTYSVEAKVDDVNRIVESNESNQSTSSSVSVSSQTQGPPDLVVNSISWSPANPEPDDQVVFSAEIENIGQTSTPSDVVHGLSFWVDGTQVSWSDSSTAALAPGEKRVLTANGGKDGDNNWIPGNEGTYSIEAKVDDVNRIVESNESNQLYNISINIELANNSGGDTNNDGVVDIVDLSTLLSSWGTNSNIADLNNDGLVDISDLSILLSNWT